MRLRLAAVSISALAVTQAAILFEDNFTTPGPKLNTAAWTTEIGAPSFLGRTQLADWVKGSGGFLVGPNGAELNLQTYNPTGFSLYGNHGKTIQTFQPAANTRIDLTVRLRVLSIQPGIVFGVYFYGCNPSPCPAVHDEIDIEILTNFFQPGQTARVNTNTYAAEPQGVGHPVEAALPPGFDIFAEHEWTIRWALDRIEYLVDGVTLYSRSAFVPQGPMQAAMIAWGPAADWPAAFDASLQPAAAAANQTNIAYVRSFRVTSVEIPEPSAAGPVLLVLAAYASRRFTTLPWTSVRRISRPPNRNVNCL
jgi:hypothetical protein